MRTESLLTIFGSNFSHFLSDLLRGYDSNFDEKKLHVSHSILVEANHKGHLKLLWGFLGSFFSPFLFPRFGQNVFSLEAVSCKVILFLGGLLLIIVLTILKLIFTTLTSKLIFQVSVFYKLNSSLDKFFHRETFPL